MELFPLPDPIPLPAPVWLFKALHSVTMVLHFTAMHFLVGGLLVATVWSLWARSRPYSLSGQAAGEISHRLPVVMAYVINLGVPPLLFTQVLYGRALYTSSVLIGVYWISVVFMVMFSYFLLYQMSARADRGAAFGWLGLVATIVVFKIGHIYSSNMTLMLRPQDWSAMYAADPLGTVLNTSDPTTLPRWVFMMVGSLGVGGIGLMLIAMRPQTDYAIKNFLYLWGGLLLSTCTLVQAACAAWVISVQPAPVYAGLLAQPVYQYAVWCWLALAALMVLIGAVAVVGRKASLGVVLAASLTGFLNLLAMALVRDGIRDLSLAEYGFDVWAQAVNTNWSTVAAFLLLFVVAVVMVSWMAWIALRANQEHKHYV
jgi:hypothetical protein